MILEEATHEAYGYYARDLKQQSIWGGFENLGYIQTVEGRTKQLKAEGYKSIFIWESDLKRKDAEKFIMHTLHKEGIK